MIIPTTTRRRCGTSEKLLHGNLMITVAMATVTPWQRQEMLVSKEYDTFWRVTVSN